MDIPQDKPNLKPMALKGDERMRTISISNQKGGCGKTTTAINLAGTLASLRKKVLVIDMDPQSHATFGLGATNQAADMSIYNVLTDVPEKKRSLSECIMNVSDNIDLIPSNILLSTLEQELKDKEDAVSKLYNSLSEYELGYDYAIIDCPPSLGFLTFNSLRAAELVIVPIDMSAFSLMGVGKLLGMLELIKLKINHSPRIKALATIYDKRTKYSQTMLDEITKFFREQMLKTVIRTSVALKKAVFSGVPVIKFDAKSNGALDYMALAREIVKIEESLEFERAIAEAAKAVDTTLTAAPRSGAVLVNSPLEPAATANRIVNIPADEPVSRDIIPAEETSIQPEAAIMSDRLKEADLFINIPAAREVYLVGDFNSWKMSDESRLSRHEDGRWQKKVALPSGKYRYKFIVDGEWTLDSKNSEKEPNPFGTFDSILRL